MSRTESAAEQVAEQMVKHQHVSMKSALERSSDVEAIAPASSLDEEIDLRVTSKISIGIVREFPIIRRLDDIIWVWKINMLPKKHFERKKKKPGNNK